MSKFPSVGVVYNKGIADKEIQEFFDWCVDNGARAFEYVWEQERRIVNYEAHPFYPDGYKAFGVDTQGRTFFGEQDSYGEVFFSIKEAREFIMESLGLVVRTEGFNLTLSDKTFGGLVASVTVHSDGKCAVALDVLDAWYGFSNEEELKELIAAAKLLKSKEI